MGIRKSFRERRRSRGWKSSQDSDHGVPVPRASPAELESERRNMSPGQLEVLSAVQRGESVFFTGAAGTGKSFLLNHIIKVLPQEGTFVTASTGIAAVAIGGTTVHSFAGVGLGDKPKEELADMASRSDVRKRWQECRVLVIDEISMIDGELFDKLEYVARRVRQKEAVRAEAHAQ